VVICIVGSEIVLHMLWLYVLVGVKLYYTCCGNIYWWQLNYTAQVVVIYFGGSEMVLHMLW